MPIHYPVTDPSSFIENGRDEKYTANKNAPSHHPPLISKLAQHPYAQDHDQQADSHNNEQREREPAQHHGARADSGLDAAVCKVLCDGRGGHGRGVLPQDRDQHEDGGDEDDGEGHLRDGPGREGLDLAVGPFAVFFLVPAWKGGEEEEADEGEDYGDDSGVTCQSSVPV